MFTWAGRVYSPPTLWSLASVRSGLLVRVVWGQAITENTFPHPMVRVLYWQARRQASIQGSEMNHGCQMASAHLCFTCGGQVGLKADLQVHNSAAGGRQPCAGLGPWEGTGLTPLTWGTLSTLLKSCLFFFFFSKMCVQALHRNTTLPGLSLCPCSFKKTAVSVLHTQLRPAHTGDLAGLKSRRVNMPIEIGPSRTFQLLENSQCWLWREWGWPWWLSCPLDSPAPPTVQS